MNVALKFNRITVGNFSEFCRIKKNPTWTLVKTHSKKKRIDASMARKIITIWPQNYETNISLICRKSTDNWIDSLISLTVLTQCTISTWICQNENQSDKSCFKYHNVDYMINRVIFNFSCKFFPQKKHKPKISREIQLIWYVKIRRKLTLVLRNCTHLCRI